jgi:hypothetical protein
MSRTGRIDRASFRPSLLGTPHSVGFWVAGMRRKIHVTVLSIRWATNPYDGAVRHTCVSSCPLVRCGGHIVRSSPLRTKKKPSFRDRITFIMENVQTFLIDLNGLSEAMRHRPDLCRCRMLPKSDKSRRFDPLISEGISPYRKSPVPVTNQRPEQDE